MKTLVFRIKVVSPVHIGTGEVFEPTDFFIDSKGKYLGEIDFNRFCNHLSDSQIEDFISHCRDRSLVGLLKLYDLVDRLCLELQGRGIDDFIIRRLRICKGFLSHYSKVKKLSSKPTSYKGLQSEFNRFTIYRTAYSPNEGLPILPGSALKGSLRTAVLNFRKGRARGESYKDYCSGKRCNSRKLESEILEYDINKINRDPFRLLKVSDLRPLGSVETKIVYAVNKRKDGTQGRGPYQILEVIEPGSVFEGKISFLNNEKGSGIKDPVTPEELKQALKMFYGDEQRKEIEILKHIGANLPIFPERGLPLRIGCHSGAECVTIEGFRRILIRGKGGKEGFSDTATTLWLSSEDPNPSDLANLQPFGWIVMASEGDEEFEKWLEEVKKPTFASGERSAEISSALVIGRLEGSSETEKQQREISGAEKLSRKEEREDLPEYKKIVLRIQDSSTSDSEIMDFYRKIEEFEKEEQRQIAQALKERWQKEGRWKVSKKRKQFQKVQKIKEILGEI